MVRFKIASNLEFDNQSKLVQEYFRHKEAITNQFRQEHEELMKAGDIDGAQKRIDQYNNDLVKLASRYPTHIDMDIVKAAGMKAAYQDETLWSKSKWASSELTYRAHLVSLA